MKAATVDLTYYNKTGAGSGNFVLFIRISNPRVLSDMGLAIPRPTRLLPALTAGLGDPRNSPGGHEILNSLLLKIRR